MKEKPVSVGKETFGLTKKDYDAELRRIIENHRTNSRLVGNPREFVLRSCRLTETWGKLASDPEVLVYIRNQDIASGRKVKMITLERGGSRQPVSKSKLIDTLYPAKRIATSSSPEEKHYNSVKSAMRGGISSQLRDFRSSVELPVVCYLTGKKIRPGMKVDVDHVGISFSELADNFLANKSLKYSEVSLEGPPTAKRFRDKELWNEWRDFHEEFARLALACASANRSKGSEGYQTPSELIGTFLSENPDELSLDF
jgi:hypothetical protein